MFSYFSQSGDVNKKKWMRELRDELIKRFITLHLSGPLAVNKEQMQTVES